MKSFDVLREVELILGRGNGLGAGNGLLRSCVMGEIDGWGDAAVYGNFRFVGQFMRRK